ncbi:MAG: Smr/MutS family protein [Methylococcales bacterium]
MTSDQNDPDDDDLFRKTIGSIKPLQTEPKYIPKKRLSSGLSINPSTAVTPSLSIPMLENSWEDPQELQLLDPTISQVFIRPGLQHRAMKQLRRGKIALDDTLDLHGATALQARQQVSRFIAVSIANNYRAVIIVHGKGLRSINNTPILKTRVNYWLRDNDNVMGFCPAAPHHGDTGALYVLLKSGKNK